MERQNSLILAIFLIALLTGCRSKTAPVLAACDLLTKESVSSIQGEQVVDATPNQSTSGELRVSQCFYKLPTYSRSVNLEVTSGQAPSIEDFWNKRFREHKVFEEEEEEMERAEKEGRSADIDKEKKASGPEPVAGLGDEAFWVANQMNGSLFIKRGAAVYRIALGGPEDSTGRLAKATALARSFLDRK